MPRRSVNQVASILERFYEQEFGGKSRGKYRLSRSGLKKLLGISKLYDVTVDKVRDELNDKGYALIDTFDDAGSFAVYDLGVFDKIRKIPVRFIENADDYLVELEPFDDDEFEDEDSAAED